MADPLGLHQGVYIAEVIDKSPIRRSSTIARWEAYTITPTRFL